MISALNTFSTFCPFISMFPAVYPFECRTKIQRAKLWRSSQWSSTVSVSTLTCDLLDGVGPHVEQHGAIQDARTQLKQTVKGQCGNIWFTPTFATVFNVLLKLQPPEDTAKTLRPAHGRIKHLTQTVKPQINAISQPDVCVHLCFRLALRSDLF